MKLKLSEDFDTPICFHGKNSVDNNSEVVKEPSETESNVLMKIKPIFMMLIFVFWKGFRSAVIDEVRDQSLKYLRNCDLSTS